jgi:hypothetical protein
MKLYSEWSDIPFGICLIRMFHERTGRHCLHLQMKIDARPWYEQPHIPAAYSQESTKQTHRVFWEWAEHNLPIFDYREKVK